MNQWVSENKGSILKYTVLAVILLLAGLYIRDLLGQKERLHSELIGQKQAYEQLSEHAAKLEIEYQSKEDMKVQLEKNWAAEKDALQGRIKILSNATFLIREAARKSDKSDVVFSNENMKFVMNEIRFENGPPVGYVLIFDDGRVTSKIYNHIIDVKTAVSRDESSGRYTIISKADFVLKSPHLSKNGPNWLNVPYPLKITGGTAFVDPTEPNQAVKKFHLWAPVLNGGFDVGTDLKPSLGVSLMGYGYSVRDLDWKFLQIGADYSKLNGAGINFTPILYRPFPEVLRNTYIGAGIGFDQRVTYNPNLSLSIGF